MNILFLHHPTVRLRAVVVGLAFFVLCLMFVFHPWRYSSLSINLSFLLWFLELVFLTALLVCVKLWALAGQKITPALPDSGNWHAPNRIPLSKRLTYVVMSTMLLAYAVYGISVDHIRIPGKKSNGVDFTGFAMWLVAMAMVLAVMNLLSVVVDHYDRRNNEMHYANFAAATEWLAWILFFVAAIIKLLSII